MTETTKEMAARLRRQHADSVTAYMEWGLTDEEKAQHARDDAEYDAARRAELSGNAERGEQLLRDERIEERMRAQDRAFFGLRGRDREQ